MQVLDTFRGQVFGLAEGLERGASLAVLATMAPFSIVLYQPFVQVGLQLIKRIVQLFAKSNFVELIAQRAVEAVVVLDWIGAFRAGIRVNRPARNPYWADSAPHRSTLPTWLS